MHNELTPMDIQKMQEEIEYRTTVLRPKIVEDVATARAFGDLSENFEYKAAKQELRRCDSRLRYLRNMIRTAKVIPTDSRAGVSGIYDKITICYEEDGETEEIQLVTTVRQNAVQGLISKESPLGRAVLGRRVGDRVEVRPDAGESYFVVIRDIQKQGDNDSLPINRF